MAENPWVGTGFEKKAFYIRDPAPWDSREQGYEALSDAQKERTKAFTEASKASLAECPKTGRMSTNVCRIKFIGKRLRK